MAEAAQIEADLDAAIEEAEASISHDQLPGDDEEAVEEPTSEDVEEEPELETAAEDEEEESAETGKSTKSAVKGSPLFRKIMDKYGGDEDKVADAIVHGWNSMSEMNKRTQQLEHELEVLKTKKPEEPAEPPIEVTEVQEEINALNDEAQSNHQEMSALIRDMDKLNAQVYKLQGKMENAEDFDKQQLALQEATLKQELAGKVKDYRGLEKANKRLERDYARNQRKLERAQKQAESAREQTATEEVRRAQVRVDASRDFADAMEEAQAKYDFPNPVRVSKLIRNEIREYIDTLLQADPDHPPIDVKAYATKALSEYAQEIGIVASKKFVAGSKAKAASLPKGKPGTGGAPVPPSKVPKTGAEARAHAERILG